MIKEIVELLSVMKPIELDKGISEELNERLCQYKWNSAGTRIDWKCQRAHKIVKFENGVELDSLKKGALLEFSAMSAKEVVLLFSADESALLIKTADLVENWPILNELIATKFFIFPRSGDGVEEGAFIECDPLNYIAGHVEENET